MKSLAQILALPFALSMMACSAQKSANMVQSSDASQIVSGTSVAKDEAVAQSTVGLLIQLKSGRESTCTGTLIDTNIILTAAHCFMNDPADPIEFVAALFVNSFEEVTAQTARGIDDAIIHPDFMPKGKGQGTWNDAALVHFVGDLPAGYKPVAFLSDLSKLQAGLSMTIAGYGLINPEGNEVKPEDAIMGTLLKATVKLTDAAHEGGELLSDTKESPASTCQGDSGGPAYAEIDGQLTVIGITSRGDSARCDTVSIFTSTAFQASFISESVAALKANPK